jgi:hypothetical protein
MPAVRAMRVPTRRQFLVRHSSTDKVFDFAYEPDFLSSALQRAWRCRRASVASLFELSLYKISSPEQDLNLQLSATIHPAYPPGFSSQCSKGDEPSFS